MKHRYFKNVVTLAVHEEKCIGCGKCVEVCPHAVFEIRARKAVMVDRDACMECGGCAKNCPSGAIDVEPGVGCAFAILMGWLTGREPHCDCGEGEGDCGSECESGDAPTRKSGCC
ncbi:MAG: mercury methylation ferredoxin HgcB [Clostridia bacterium]